MCSGSCVLARRHFFFCVYKSDLNILRFFFVLQISLQTRHWMHCASRWCLLSFQCITNVRAISEQWMPYCIAFMWHISQFHAVGAVGVMHEWTWFRCLLSPSDLYAYAAIIFAMKSSQPRLDGYGAVCYCYLIVNISCVWNTWWHGVKRCRFWYRANISWVNELT